MMLRFDPQSYKEAFHYPPWKFFMDEEYGSLNNKETLDFVCLLERSDKGSFLHDELEEEIYMRHPKGYTNYSSLVYRMRKSWYGLKKAPKAWNPKLNSFLLS